MINKRSCDGSSPMDPDRPKQSYAISRINTDQCIKVQRERLAFMKLGKQARIDVDAVAQHWDAGPESCNVSAISC